MDNPPDFAARRGQPQVDNGAAAQARSGSVCSGVECLSGRVKETRIEYCVDGALI
jgi:hypothetical protein